MGDSKKEPPTRGQFRVKGPRSMLSIAPLCVARPLARGLELRASTAAEGPRASPRGWLGPAWSSRGWRLVRAGPGPQPTVDSTPGKLR